MTEIKYPTEKEIEDMTEIHPTDEEMEAMTEIQYPTEEELEWMYEEYIKSGSFEDIFGIKESKDTEFPFQSYNIIVTKIIY